MAAEHWLQYVTLLSRVNTKTSNTFLLILGEWTEILLGYLKRTDDTRSISIFHPNVGQIFWNLSQWGENIWLSNESKDLWSSWNILQCKLLYLHKPNCSWWTRTVHFWSHFDIFKYFSSENESRMLPFQHDPTQEEIMESPICGILVTKRPYPSNTWYVVTFTWSVCWIA